MKKLLIAILFLFCIKAFAQTDGISYQAVIIGPDNQELPGVDAEGNILPDATIALRFTVIDANNATEYQEVQTTNTDQYGRINLLIGEMDPDGFAQISWDGTNKDFRVEIDFSGGSSFVDMSREQLTFLPFAYHRNITATGTLNVDDDAFLNGELTVQGPTNLNSTLDVNNNNKTNLSGELHVEGKTVLKDTLSIINEAPAFLSGDLTVDGTANLNDVSTNSLVVETTSHLKGITNIDSTTTIKGQVTIKPILENKDAAAAISPLFDDTTNQNNYDQYPLMVEGSHQGIAIKVNDSRGRQNNYISFWDSSGTNNVPVMWGRIEGQNNFDLWTDHEFQTEVVLRTTDVIINGIEALIALFESGQSVVKLTAAATSSTACVGLGACITTPIPSLIVESSSNSILKFANAVAIGGNLLLAIAEEGAFILFKELNIGVSYQSGAGDYAEWLPKENLSDVFTAGELVGVKNGLVTKKTWGVEKIMIVSTNPIVLGNMPQPNHEKNNVKIAFMGQVPVNVLGKVVPGDYILPSELGNGFAKAVHPKDMKTRDYKKVAGVAWSNIKEIRENFNIVNVAVGINTNDLCDVVYKQEEELKALQEVYGQLKVQIEQSNSVLANLVPGYAEAAGITESIPRLKGDNNKAAQDKKHIENNITYVDEDNIIYFEISRTHIETAIEMAREQYQQILDDSEQMKKLLFGEGSKLHKGMDDIILLPIEDHPFWQKIDNNPAYKEDIIQLMLSQLEKAFHTHKKYAHKFADLKMKKD